MIRSKTNTAVRKANGCIFYKKKTGLLALFYIRRSNRQSFRISILRKNIINHPFNSFNKNRSFSLCHATPPEGRVPPPKPPELPSDASIATIINPKITFSAALIISLPYSNMISLNKFRFPSSLPSLHILSFLRGQLFCIPRQKKWQLPKS